MLYRRRFYSHGVEGRRGLCLTGGFGDGEQSGIHGWGLFAMVDMKQDSMVAEYCGALLRPTVANMKEKRYRARGTDCYLFTISDKWVIDATMCGTIARFTVRCPSLHQSC